MLRRIEREDSSTYVKGIVRDSLPLPSQPDQVASQASNEAVHTSGFLSCRSCGIHLKFRKSPSIHTGLLGLGRGLLQTKSGVSSPDSMSSGGTQICRLQTFGSWEVPWAVQHRDMAWYAARRLPSEMAPSHGPRQCINQPARRVYGIIAGAIADWSKSRPG